MKMEMIAKLAIVALVANSMWVVSNAQSSGLSSTCNNVLITLSPCLNYITGNTSTPTSGCCTQLQNVVTNNPQCLCQVISGNASSLAGLPINRTQALNLPTACRVQTPPTSQCSNADSPSGSPVGATPKTDSTTPSGGSMGTPTTEDGSSDANNVMSTGIPLLLAVFVVAYSVLSS